MSPPGRARHAAAGSRQRQLAFVVARQRRRPLDPAQHDLVTGSTPARRHVGSGGNRTPPTPAPPPGPGEGGGTARPPPAPRARGGGRKRGGGGADGPPPAGARG